jgi:hypothetical protein
MVIWSYPLKENFKWSIMCDEFNKILQKIQKWTQNKSLNTWWNYKMVAEMESQRHDVSLFMHSLSGIKAWSGKLKGIEMNYFN